ncbi:Phage antirepressor protein KilAC domain protein [compost metagenome]
MTVDQVAKMLGWKPKRLRDTLREKRVLRKDGLPYQRFTPRYFEVIPYVSPSGTARPYSRITTEGVAYIERLLVGKVDQDVTPTAEIVELDSVRPPTVTISLRLNA